MLLASCRSFTVLKLNANDKVTAYCCTLLTLYLHCTSSLMPLEVSFPRLFLATHRYSPPSSLLTFVTVKCLFSADKLILKLLVITDPSLVHDNVGTGFPVALQDRVAFFPSSALTLWERLISGISIGTQWNKVIVSWINKAKILAVWSLNRRPSADEWFWAYCFILFNYFHYYLYYYYFYQDQVMPTSA